MGAARRRDLVSMKLSKFGNKFTGHSGILSLMDDLGAAMAAGSGDVLMLGGGNPGRVPAMEAMFRAPYGANTRQAR